MRVGKGKNLTCWVVLILFMAVSFAYVPSAMAMQIIKRIFNPQPEPEPEPEPVIEPEPEPEPEPVDDEQDSAEDEGYYEDRAVTGYYYDPDGGNLIPKYDDLNPAESYEYRRQTQ